MSLQCEGDIGATCDFEGCDVFDFLPWFCGDCGGRFCSTHRLAVDHRCQASEESERDFEMANALSSNHSEVSVSIKSDATVETQKVSQPLRAEDAVCDICGNIGCLLHALHPEIVEQIAAERREALARRVWTGSNNGGVVGGGGKIKGSGGLDSNSSDSFHLPWRIGKLTAKQSKANTVTNTTARLAPRELALTGYTVQCVHIYIHSHEVNNEDKEIPICIDSISGTESDKNNAVVAVPSSSSSSSSVFPPIVTHTVSVLIKKATISHGVSIGYVADAMRSLVGREIDPSVVTCGGVEAERQAKVNSAEKEKHLAVAHNGDNVQLSSASATLYLPTCVSSTVSLDTKIRAAATTAGCGFGFRALTGLDGESAYLIDSLTGKGQQKKNKNNEENDDATKSNGGELEEGGGRGVTNESLLFCVINASNAHSLPSAAPSPVLELEALAALCELFLSRPTLSGPAAAQSFSSSSCLTADTDGRPISFKFAFPQFPTSPTDREHNLPSQAERQHCTQTGGKRPRDTAASSTVTASVATEDEDSGNNGNDGGNTIENATRENNRTKSVGEFGAFSFTIGQRLAWQQIATLIRMRSKRGRIVSHGSVAEVAASSSSFVSDGGDGGSGGKRDAAQRERDTKMEKEVKQVPEDEATTSKSTVPEKEQRDGGVEEDHKPSGVVLASFFSEEFDFYKDSVKPIFGGGGGPAPAVSATVADDNTKAHPANKPEEAPWTFADLPVSYPKSNPINAKDPLASKIPTSSRAIIGVQVLPLRPLPKKSTTPPSSTSTTTAVDLSTPQLRKHIVLPSFKAKAFCMVVDTKWSVGRLLEKIRSEAGLPTPATTQATATIPPWSLVSIEVSAAVLAPSSSPPSRSYLSPPFALKNVSSDLSTLGEAVGIQNGSLILLVENDISSLSRRVRIPNSLLPFLDGAFASPTLTAATSDTRSAATVVATHSTLAERKLAPKSEAKIRKDCVVQ